MLAALRRPLPLPILAAGVVGVGLLVALYCLAYTTATGQPETFLSALGWAAANICPWLFAIEGGKRAASGSRAAAVLAAALVGSLLMGYLLGGGSGPLPFELVRRLPALAAVAALVTLLRSAVGTTEKPVTDIPLTPAQIDWVQAAGNYVELRANGRTVVHRGSMRRTERHLADHGFVRIHRSTLVRRDRIAQVRPNDVILTDGTHLKLGKRYRAALVH